MVLFWLVIREAGEQIDSFANKCTLKLLQEAVVLESFTGDIQTGVSKNASVNLR